MQGLVNMFIVTDQGTSSSQEEIEISPLLTPALSFYNPKESIGTDFQFSAVFTSLLYSHQPRPLLPEGRAQIGVRRRK